MNENDKNAIEKSYMVPSNNESRHISQEQVQYRGKRDKPSRAKKKMTS
jgi:hypothetical protein